MSNAGQGLLFAKLAPKPQQQQQQQQQDPSSFDSYLHVPSRAHFATLLLCYLLLAATLLGGFYIIVGTFAANQHPHRVDGPVGADGAETKEVAALFRPQNAGARPPPLPPPPLALAQPVPLRRFDTLFRMADGTVYDRNQSRVRVFDLGDGVGDMDMPSIVSFSICCNDRTVVVCDTTRSAATNANAALRDRLELSDYTINCLLSHDPSTPSANTDKARYRHRWKLIVEFGPAFERAGELSTDCTFTVSYYTSARPQPPPPPPPSNVLVQKIW